MRIWLVVLGMVVLGLGVGLFVSQGSSVATPAGQERSTVFNPQLASMESRGEGARSDAPTGEVRVALSDPSDPSATEVQVFEIQIPEDGLAQALEKLKR